MLGAMMSRRLATLFCLTLLASSGAQAGGWSKPEDDRVVLNLTVYGDDACPAGNDGTIIVCARRPESERYRIPGGLRPKPADAPPTVQAWGAQVQSLEAAGRVQLPNSCSPVGANGSGGCSLAMLRQWYAERQLDGWLPPAR